jgi:pSer/pThr/pTyr-binding forkhead associated (FHA) protein
MSGPIVLALRLLMAMALYGFLGWTLYFLWREIQRQGVLLAGRRIPGINLVVSQEGHSAHVAKYFSQPEVILGRDPGCDVPLTDDTVSTRHAQLTYHHNQWWIVDLTSTNGTFINGTKVSMPTVITSGDVIKCGNVHLFVDFLTGVIVSPTERLGKSDE